MHSCRPLIIIAAPLMCCSLYAFDANATIRNAASCSSSAVATAIAAAVDGDTVAVPAGDCTYSTWVSINKRINVIGNGIDATFIRNGASNGGLRIQSSNAAIQGFTFDCNNNNTSNQGIVMVGLHEVLPVAQYGDWRITGNKFIKCGSATTWVTGYSAITIRGFVWGLIDHNQFVNCSGECIDYCSNYVTALAASVAFGQYTNGTVFIEDNTFTFTDTSHPYENLVDTNSGARVTFRHNTIDICNGCGFGSGIYSTHETCATCTGGSADAGTLITEFYENTIITHSTGSAEEFVRLRGGKALIYNNTITGTGAVGVGVITSDYRSFNYGNCEGASHGRGYSEWCHDPDASGYTHEGLESAKTTLSAGITTSQTTIPLTSVTGFATNGVASGNSIIIGTEQIDYTGISGNNLTGVIRGANSTTAASHTSGSSVGYLIFGQCIEQPNNVYIWGNPINTVNVQNQPSSSSHNDYSRYDIQSFSQRPNNWQYQNDGTAYSYTPYPYPHPLVTGTAPPSAPKNLRIQ